MKTCMRIMKSQCMVGNNAVYLYKEDHLHNRYFAKKVDIEWESEPHPANHDINPVVIIDKNGLELETREVEINKQMINQKEQDKNMHIESLTKIILMQMK